METKTFMINLSCAYCGSSNEIIYGSQLDFSCTRCKKLSFICADFTSIPITSTNEELITDAIEMSTTACLSPAGIKKLTKEYIRGLCTRLNGDNQ